MRAALFVCSALVPAALMTPLASAQTWTEGTANGMTYEVRLPAGFDPSKSYPLVLYEHMLGMGYSAQAVRDLVEQYYGPAASAHPAIVVAPVLPDSGPDNNFGGVGGSTPAEENTVRAVRQVMTQYKVDPSQVLATGGSMGGLGTWQLAVDCNSQNGTLTVDGQPCRQFTAFMPIDGGMNNLGGNWQAEQQIAAQLLTVPIYAIHGTQDSQVPTQFDTDMRQLMAGDPTFKSAAPNAGHGTWNQYYQDPATWNWLFSQGGSTVHVAAVPPASLANTVPIPSPVPIQASTAPPRSVTHSSGGSSTGNDDSYPVTAVPSPAPLPAIASAQPTVTSVPTLSTPPAAASVAAVPPSSIVQTTMVCGASTGAGTGQFQVVDGKFIDPHGNVFIARGLNADQSVDPNAILQNFAGVNFVRLALGQRLPAADIQNFVNTLTSHGVVVEIEDHPWPLVDAYSGSDLAAETGWYSSLASTFRSNPYVWFGTMNEPQGGDIPRQQVAIYNAVRGTGANNVVMMEAGLGGGDPGQVGPTALPASDYAGMHNVAWDIHIYGWLTQGSTDQAKIDSMIQGNARTGTGIAAAQQIKSADGTIPVLIGEFGPAAAGYTQNGDQVINGVVDAVQSGQAQGFSGWDWGSNDADALIVNGALTRWGQILSMAVANDCTVQSAGQTSPPVAGARPGCPAKLAIVHQRSSLAAGQSLRGCCEPGCALVAYTSDFPLDLTYTV